jgi:peptide/nickel transport system substrate-binding protein
MRFVFPVRSHARLLLAILTALIASAAAHAQSLIGSPGGRLVVAQRSAAKTLNPVFAIDEPSRAVTGLMHAALVRIHPETGVTEGVLAESWKVSAGGREIAMRLRSGLKFSDGAPLTTDDVLFTLQVHLDPKTGSPQRELLTVSGQPVRFEKTGERDLRFVVAEPYALGERMLGGIAILPKRLLSEPYRQGKLSSTWSLNTPPDLIAGAGPFRLVRYEPGERIVLARNPQYWKKDPAGHPLPYLDEIEFAATAGEDAQVARILGGAADLIAGFGGGSYATLERAQRNKQLRVFDAGAGLDYTFLLFNLNPVEGVAPPARGWFRRTAFRQAVSAAVDRRAIANLVYRGRATPLWGHVTSGRRQWRDGSVPTPEPSAGRARELLRQSGFRWDGQGRLIDEKGNRVDFTLIANSANPAYTQTASIVQEDLKPLGIETNVVPLEFRSLVDRVIHRRDFDAAIMAFRPGDADPVADMNVLMSEGRTRLWNMSGRPVEDWEAEIDRLMRRQIGTIDFARRKADFDRVQRILAGQQPFVCLVSPNVLVAAVESLRNLRPVILGDPALWNADEIFRAPVLGTAAPPR